MAKNKSTKSKHREHPEAGDLALVHLMTDALLGHTDATGLQFIRRTDEIEVLDLTTMERNVKLEIELPANLNAECLPIGLLAKNSYLGRFSIVDREGRRLASPSRSDMKDEVKNVIREQLEKAEQKNPELEEEDNEELCNQVVNCRGGPRAEDLCPSCCAFYISVNRNASDQEVGSMKKSVPEPTSMERLQRRIYGCRALAILAERITSRGSAELGRTPIAAKDFMGASDRSYAERRNLLRLLFDLADSSVLVCDLPPGASGRLTLSYAYDEQIEEWKCPGTQVAEAKYEDGGRKADGGPRQWFHHRWMHWCNERRKRAGKFAGRWAIRNDLNKIGQGKRAARRRLRERLSGYKSWCVYWESPSVGDYGSYHCDIRVPEGLSIRRATMVAVGPVGLDGGSPKQKPDAMEVAEGPAEQPDEEATAWERCVPFSPDELGRRSHLVISAWKQSRGETRGRSAARRCHAATIVQIVSTDVVTWTIGALLGIFSAVLLLAFLIVNHSETNANTDAVVTLLITAPTLVGAFVGVRASNEIGAKLLEGPILRIGLVAISAALSAVVIATCDTNSALPTVALWVAFTVSFVMGVLLFVGRSLGRGDRLAALREIQQGQDTDFLNRYPIVDEFVRGGEGERYVPTAWRVDDSSLFGEVPFPDDRSSVDGGPTREVLDQLYESIGRCLQTNESDLGDGERLESDA